ncbi:MAG: hypothetical protein U9Q30_05965 [Campylobacterota bacterium]|nr:hypothetical protein [Campylobacterota bacterium]
MEKLVSSSEAAKILGISLQGIHYRIKKGQLKSLKQDGKIFVYVDQDKIGSIKDETSRKISHSTIKDESLQQFSGYDVIKVKDEQIELLKKTIKFIKKQKDSEIERLQEEQNRIVNVFQSEVDLLKSAFNEMKSIYQIENNSSNNKVNKKDDIIVDDVIVEDIKDDKKDDKQKSQAQSVKDRLEAIRQSNIKNSEKKDSLQKERITEVEELIKVEKPIKKEKEILSLKDFFVLMRNHNKTNSEIKLIILDRIRENDERFEYNSDTQDVTIYKDEFLDLF